MTANGHEKLNSRMIAQTGRMMSWN